MKDPGIERTIEAAIPELKLALRSIVEGSAVQIFTLADGVNQSTGVRSKILCFVVNDLSGAILEGTARGIEDSQKLLNEKMAQLAKRQGAAS